MDIAPDCRNPLKEIEGLTTAKRNTPEGDRLDVFVTMVEACERKHYRFDLPDPVEKFNSATDRVHACVSGLKSDALSEARSSASPGNCHSVKLS